MRVSTRNVFGGKIKSIKRGVVNAEVTIEIAPDVEMTAGITLEAIKRLGLRKGADAYAIIKASDVMVGTPHHKRGV